jgi:hypothetical protein
MNPSRIETCENCGLYLEQHDNGKCPYPFDVEKFKPYKFDAKRIEKTIAQNHSPVVNAQKDTPSVCSSQDKERPEGTQNQSPQLKRKVDQLAKSSEDTPEGREKVRRSTNSGTYDYWDTLDGEGTFNLSEKIKRDCPGEEDWIYAFYVKTFIQKLKEELEKNKSDKEDKGSVYATGWNCATEYAIERIDKLAGEELSK